MDGGGGVSRERYRYGQYQFINRSFALAPRQTDVLAACHLSSLVEEIAQYPPPRQRYFFVWAEGVGGIATSYILSFPPSLFCPRVHKRGGKCHHLHTAVA